MTKYHELTRYLFSLNRSKELKTDLSAPMEMAEKLDHPEKKFPSVHIAGTNGKGTVAYKLAAVLQENGYRVGLFTSPHLETYRERIQINGKMISEVDVVEGVEKILPLTKNPKFFEITTLLAFDYFAEQEVDIAIVEAGLGGRLDATNILTPIVSIITSIDWDHVPILGDTLEDIAYEKSGIIKPGVPCVIGKSADYEIMHKKACPLYIVPNDSKKIAQKVLKLLPFDLEETNGLRKDPPCRFEKRGEVILDVAHNPAALRRLFDRVKREYPGKRIHVLLGMSKDKDIKESLRIIREKSDAVTFLEPHHPRLHHFEGAVSAAEGLERAKSEGAICVVCGSFYIMKDLLPLLRAPESREKKGYSHPSDQSQKTSQPPLG
ncbi:MAG: bifunctional folylpolyglutamate synthase/dihydrofolate synthase [Chlamydiales bacterium]|nr:bifunctional folylpolyglutamate synthase/dihydrofolate synthase [Chlamydiales bacterium]